MEKFYNNKDFSDFKITSLHSSREWFVHKVFLSANCKYFELMFKESEDEICDHSFDFDENSIELLLKYMYGINKTIKKENLIQLFKIANYLLYDSLIDELGKSIIEFPESDILNLFKSIKNYGNVKKLMSCYLVHNFHNLNDEFLKERNISEWKEIFISNTKEIEKNWTSEKSIEIITNLILIGKPVLEYITNLETDIKRNINYVLNRIDDFSAKDRNEISSILLSFRHICKYACCDTASGKYILLGNDRGSHGIITELDNGHSVNMGGCNTAIGSNSLTSITTGNSNTAVGYSALTLNTAIGSNSLTSITTGSYNTAVGYSSF